MKKIGLSVLALLIISCVLTGCFFPLGDLDELKDGLDRFQEEMSLLAESLNEMSWPEFSYPQQSDIGEQSDVFEISEDSDGGYPSYPDESEQVESIPEPEESITEPEVSDPYEALPEFDTLDEVRDYMNGKKEADIFDFEFFYTGDKTKLDGPTIARITSSCLIYHAINGDKYKVTLVEYPGDRIVDAYFSGDSSTLTANEVRALNKAVSMVEKAKGEATSDIELEIILHDMLASEVNYYDGTTDVLYPKDPPRHLTAIGALLDGKANCQGYTDGFYVLASIAGFKVGRMNVYDYSGWHILNTIMLDGKWYVVDVTFNDCMADGNEYIPSYRLFNAGEDKILEYFWGSEMEYYPLETVSDEKYFYFMPENEGENGYKKAYDDINVMAQDIIDRFLDNGQTMQCVMYVNTVADWKKLSTALENTDYRNVTITWTIWTYTNGNDTFYTLKLW